eukprot:COSAG02_NODE_1457_length_12507_cov_7.416989_4_plen_85_part_00
MSHCELAGRNILSDRNSTRLPGLTLVVTTYAHLPCFYMFCRLDTLSVLAARGRAQVSVVAATTGWPKRAQDMRYGDQDDHGTAD